MTKPRVKLFNGEPVYVLGKCDRHDEGWVGHDLKCRPVRLGTGEYTFVTAPDCLDEAKGGQNDPHSGS